MNGFMPLRGMITYSEAPLRATVLAYI